MDIIKDSKAWAKQEQKIAEALKLYRRKSRPDRKPLTKLFERYGKSMPISLYRGIREILVGKQGAPTKLTASDKMSRFTMAVCVHALREEGQLLDPACEQVAELFGVSDSKVKHAYYDLLR